MARLKRTLGEAVAGQSAAEARVHLDCVLHCIAQSCPGLAGSGRVGSGRVWSGLRLVFNHAPGVTTLPTLAGHTARSIPLAGHTARPIPLAGHSHARSSDRMPPSSIDRAPERGASPTRYLAHSRTHSPTHTISHLRLPTHLHSLAGVGAPECGRGVEF